MIRLFTAVGTCSVLERNGKRRTVLQTGCTLYYANPAEVLLWRECIWTILTYEELEERFNQAMEAAHLSDGVSFDWYLHHLLEVGVLAQGEDETMEDALYDLLKSLYIIVPRAAALPVKLYSFISMVLQGCPVKMAAKIFHHPRYDGVKGQVIGKARKGLFTTAELIHWFQTGVDGHPDKEIYSEGVTPDNINRISRFDSDRLFVLKAVADLYFEHEIMLESTGGKA